jgi:hypothetical protein
VLDVREEQLLVLLLMMTAKKQNGDSELAIARRCAFECVAHATLDGRSIVAHLVHAGPRQQAAARAVDPHSD